MNIFFRVDASVEIGTGHVMRCLTLADWLTGENTNIFFVCRKAEGNMEQIITERGYEVIMLDYEPFHMLEDAREFLKQTFDREIDLLIIDHYGIDINWEKQIRPYVKKIFVIDDLANRKHDCDVLLDQNFFLNMEERYDGLVPKYCQLLLGPKYLLLRKEFYKIKRHRRTDMKRIFVFFGGSDPTDETTKALHALSKLELNGMVIDVVVGASNPKRMEIEVLCSRIGAHFHCQVNHIAHLMAQADFALGAGGVTMWERCFVGLPTLVTIVADNQRKSTEDAAKAGAIELLGWHEDVTVDTYVAGIKNVLKHPQKLMKMQEKGYELVGDFSTRKVHPVAPYIRGLIDC